MEGMAASSGNSRFVLAFAVAMVSLPFVALVGAATLLLAKSVSVGDASRLFTDAGAAFARSGAVAIITAFLITLIGLACGTAFASDTLRPEKAGLIRKLTLVAPLALVPLFIGSGSFAFIFREVAGPVAHQFGLGERGSSAWVLIEVIAQLIRYTPLVLWLIMLTSLQSSFGIRTYTRQIGVSGVEYGRIHLLSAWLQPVLIVSAFAFQDAANDFSIAHLFLRPSVATNTELIGHALSRTYFVDISLHSPPDAIARLIVKGSVAAIGFAGLFAIIAWLTVRWARLAPARTTRLIVQDRGAISLGLWPTLAVLAMTCVLTAASLSILNPSSWTRLALLMPSALVALTTAVLSWLIAAPIIFFLRDKLRIQDRSAPRAVALAGAIAISIGFVPPLTLASAILGLAYQLNIVGNVGNTQLLLIAELTRFTPIAFVFLAPSALSIPDSQLDYLKQVGANGYSRLYVSFLRPYFWLHLAIMLVILNLVLNESVIASVFQSDIPNLADFVARATMGRSADYGMVGSIILLQATLFGALLLFWGRSAAMTWKHNNA
jgi:hypothetical protein